MPCFLHHIILSTTEWFPIRRCDSGSCSAAKKLNKQEHVFLHCQVLYKNTHVYATSASPEWLFSIAENISTPIKPTLKLDEINMLVFLAWDLHHRQQDYKKTELLADRLSGFIFTSIITVFILISFFICTALFFTNRHWSQSSFTEIYHFGLNDATAW